VIHEFLGTFVQLEGKKIFKSDLWEEAIDLERSFCKGVLENYKNLFLAGIDISPFVVKRAIHIFAPLGGHFEFGIGDMKNIPYKSNSFDFIYSSGSIEHILDPQEALKEYYRILKPKGIAFISVPSRFSYYRILQEVAARLVKGLHYGQWEKKFTRKELQKMIEAEGFKLIKIKKILLNPPYFHHLYRFRPFSKILPPLYQAILKLENTWINEWIGKDLAVIAMKKEES
jgi:SAM-dependent methyltransferase